MAEFLKAAKEVDMFVMFRIGPYMNAERDLGGFPAWLLRDPHMNLRSTYKPYITAVGKYYEKILEIINKYQFTKGGPIIAMQFENEFMGIYNAEQREYMTFLKDTITKSGFNELLFINNYNPLDVLNKKGTYPGKCKIFTVN